MARVYRARDITNDEIVAVKVLNGGPVMTCAGSRASMSTRWARCSTDLSPDASRSSHRHRARRDSIAARIVDPVVREAFLDGAPWNRYVRGLRAGSRAP